MKISWFHLMPYRWLPSDFREKYHGVWVDLPNRLYDPERGHQLYNEYLDMLEYADQCGSHAPGRVTTRSPVQALEATWMPSSSAHATRVPSGENEGLSEGKASEGSSSSSHRNVVPEYRRRTSRVGVPSCSAASLATTASRAPC